MKERISAFSPQSSAIDSRLFLSKSIYLYIRCLFKAQIAEISHFLIIRKLTNDNVLQFTIFKLKDNLVEKKMLEEFLKQ